MATRHPLSKDFLEIAHLPTWMLIIGYPVYWLELFVFKSGQGMTSILAWVLFIVTLFALGYLDRKVVGNSLKESIRWFSKQSLWDRLLIGGGVACTAVILGVAVYAWLLPLHLVQETDFLIYHVMLPRQHLLRGTFEFISWSPFDLFLLPVDYAIAPFTLATVFPNKIPQMIFFIGLILVAVSLMDRRPLPSILMVFLILGSHGIGIQMGTAMLDLAIAYLLLASWDSLRRGRTALFIVEFCFYFWSKPFVPVQTVILIVGLFVVYRLIRLLGKTKVEILSGEIIQDPLRLSKKNIAVLSLGFAALSTVVAGPFIARSMVHAGTPLFPFLPGAVMINRNIDKTSPHWRSIEDTSRVVTERGRAYGHGRDPVAFLKHFWLLAVPEEGVNNRYDYPAGLPFLLVLAPFFYMLVKSVRNGKFNVVLWFAALYWGLWWMSSQQMRFLYITILLMFVAVVFDTKKLSRSLLFCILVALALNALSVFRAHKMDFGKSYAEMLRPKDEKLVQLSRDYIQTGQTGDVVLEYDYGDVAFAQFPAVIKKVHPPYILATE